MNQIFDQQRLAAALRALAMDAVEKAKSGHPGMPLGMADVATCLFSRHLKFDAKNPDYPDRDRFILSAGHGSVLLYGLLYLTGYEGVTLDHIKQFRQLGSPTAGHPEYGHLAGVETTTGPLGQGLANGVGFSLAERLMNATFGDDLVDHYTYVIAGDGCLMEGISQEAISLAGHLGLGKLIVLWDDNGITIDGAVSLSDSTNQLARFSASNWHTLKVDGHDFAAIDEAIAEAKRDDRPSLIACRTVIGFGAPTKAGKAASHGAPLGEDEIVGAREAIGWPYEAFDIPSDIMDAWRLVGLKGHAGRQAWEQRLSEANDDLESEFRRRLSGDPTDAFTSHIEQLLKQLSVDPVAESTRKASQRMLSHLTALLPELIGGSADLTGSNLTKTEATLPVSKDDFSGRYIYYGIREHAMAAIMNGLALHGGLKAYGGTFLVFSDYCRPAIRLAALMKLPVIYVMTHDSIGVGEDGPTHQPVEHFSTLRAIPNLAVYRPADAVETLEAYALALADRNRPSLLCLSRQNVAAVRCESWQENCVSKGVYKIFEGGLNPAVKIFASGTEVRLAIDVAAQLGKASVDVDVYSAPDVSGFLSGSTAYQKGVLGGSALRVVIEPGVRQGWERILGDDGLFFGVETFGASGPAPDVYAHFGLSVDAISRRIMEALEPSE